MPIKRSIRYNIAKYPLLVNLGAYGYPPYCYIIYMIKNVDITGTIECKTATAKITIEFTQLGGLSKLKHPYSDTYLYFVEARKEKFSTQLFLDCSDTVIVDGKAYTGNELDTLILKLRNLETVQALETL